MAYERQRNEKYVKSAGFKCRLLDRYDCFACNEMFTNMKLFDSIIISDYDILIAFGWRKDKWIVSLYTKEDYIDVSVIAKFFGGGGHKQAAGFEWKGDIWNLLIR